MSKGKPRQLRATQDGCTHTGGSGGGQGGPCGPTLRPPCRVPWDIGGTQSLQGPRHSVTQHGGDLKGTMEGVVAANYLTIIIVE